MKRSSLSPSWAADYAEAQASKRLERERAINQVIASRNPNLPDTEAYRRGPVSPMHPMFPTKASYTEYLARREMGRFNPTIKFPTR